LAIWFGLTAAPASEPIMISLSGVRAIIANFGDRLAE